MSNGFPNPFGRTLCVPHLVFFPLLACIRLLFWQFRVWATEYLGETMNSPCHKIIKLHLANAKMRNGYRIKKPSNQAERDVLQRCQEAEEQLNTILIHEHCLNADVASVLYSFLDLQPSAVSQLIVETQREAYSLSAELINNFDAVWICCSLFLGTALSALSFVAVCIEWTVHLSEHSNASGFASYNALCICFVLYVSAMPFGGVMHGALMCADTESLKPFMRDVVSFYYQLRVVATLVMCSTLFVTHIIPSLFIFLLVPLFVATAVLTFHALYYFCDDYLDACFVFFDELGDDVGFKERVFATLSLLFVDLVVSTSFVAVVYLYSGRNWLDAAMHSFTGDYCSHSAHATSWIVFRTADFSWREWVLILGWLFN